MKDTFELILKAHTQVDYALHCNAADEEANDLRKAEMERLLLAAREALRAAGILGWAIGTMCPITDSINTTKSIDAEDFSVTETNYSTVSF